jgi:hypothetical protein
MIRYGRGGAKYGAHTLEAACIDGGTFRSVQYLGFARYWTLPLLTLSGLLRSRSC